MDVEGILVVINLIIWQEATREGCGDDMINQPILSKLSLPLWSIQQYKNHIQIHTQSQ